MPRLARRHKVISIRVSGEEFDHLQRLCLTKGADSISELSRRAIRLFLLQENKYDTAELESRVSEMQVRIAALDQEVARVAHIIGLGRLETALQPEQMSQQAAGGL